jgi:hypothetical protein
MFAWVRPVRARLHSDAAPTPIVGLRVAVPAKKLEILDSVVTAITIDVVQLHIQRLTHPTGDPAALAAVLLQTLLDQALLEMTATRLGAPCDKQLLNRDLTRTGRNRSPSHGMSTRRGAKAESLHALAYGKPRCVGFADRAPVVASVGVPARL